MSGFQAILAKEERQLRENERTPGSLLYVRRLTNAMLIANLCYVTRLLGALFSNTKAEGIYIYFMSKNNKTRTRKPAALYGVDVDLLYTPPHSLKQSMVRVT